jgi:hypothetical protein
LSRLAVFPLSPSAVSHGPARQAEPTEISVANSLSSLPSSNPRKKPPELFQLRRLCFSITILHFAYPFATRSHLHRVCRFNCSRCRRRAVPHGPARQAGPTCWAGPLGVNANFCSGWQFSRCRHRQLHIVPPGRRDLLSMLQQTLLHFAHPLAALLQLHPKSKIHRTFPILPKSCMYKSLRHVIFGNPRARPKVGAIFEDN